MKRQRTPPKKSRGLKPKREEQRGNPFSRPGTEYIAVSDGGLQVTYFWRGRRPNELC